MDNIKKQAKCRGCGKSLRGDDYMYGGRAFDPDNNEQCKINYYGGFVCSRSCDYRASLELERSMPGHSYSDTGLGCFSSIHLDRNWRKHSC
jgi:hypothetical protein